MAYSDEMLAARIRLLEDFIEWYDIGKDADKQIAKQKPLLHDAVVAEGGELVAVGKYRANIIKTAPVPNLIGKAELLRIVPSQYHDAILRPMRRKDYVKLTKI